MPVYLAAAALVVAAAGTAYSAYSGEQNRTKASEAADLAKEQAVIQEADTKKALSLQEQTMRNQEKSAVSTEKRADEANNAAGRKTPDTAAILSKAQQAATGGAGSTMLTGPQGIDPNVLQLGKTSLLG